MKILFLAPQPFFQDRGTPIAVKLALEVLARRRQDEIQVLTFHEGRNVEIPGVQAHRIRAPRWLNQVRPGISLKKLLCDAIFLVSAIRLVWQNRRQPFHLVHAVEEAAFIAWFIRLIWGIPYIYDMDSSLALQVTEKWFWLKPLYPVLRYLEGVAIRGSTAVVPVCDALAVIATEQGSKDLQILRDISLLDFSDPEESKNPRDLRAEAGLDPAALTLLYIGNLESYQGIDLLLAAFAAAKEQDVAGHLVIIGGVPADIQRYRQQVSTRSLSSWVHFLGQRPVSALNAYLKQADILLSPRTRGNNTPMKIYSYLHSGKAIAATRLPTHTQVLNDEVARLADPTPAAFGAALVALISDPALRERLGQAAFALAEERYTFEVFTRNLNALYDRVAGRLADI